MLILLPPSESKAASGRRGRPLHLDDLSFAALNPTRRRLLTSLETLARGPRSAALEALKLPPGLSDQVELDLVLESTPAVPVERLYTGVLYDALSLQSLTPAARRRARAWIVVSSALFGAVRLSDRLPPYRLSIDARLQQGQSLASAWRAPLEAALPASARSGLVIDLRSSGYAAMWRPSPPLAARTATVRILHEIRPGDPSSRSVVSHFNKATKGALVRALVESGLSPRTPKALPTALGDLGYTTELTAPQDRRATWGLDVIVSELLHA